MEGFCRGCLIKYNDPMELLQYTEKYRRLFVYSTGLQVKRNDTITFQLCKDCFLNMKAACKFKKTCRASDKRLKSYLALKDVGDGVDFCTFLKNSDDTINFRLPLMSGASTPANHKARDDDNESTCTSIRNFMTDILEGEEMPDTEARIIREVIEEEADVLDDSLDSHWLQDDASIDTDFRLDFSFSPFATPRSVNNDHCYTPKTFMDQREEQGQPRKYFTSISPAKHHKVANDFTDIIKNNHSEKELCIFETDGINHEESAVNFDMPVIDTETIHDFDIPTTNDEKAINNLDIPSIDSDKLINNLDLPTSINNNDKSIDDLDIPSIDSEKLLNNFGEPTNDDEKSSNNLDIPSFDSEKSLTNLDLPSLPSIENDASINHLDLPIIDNENDDKNQGINVKNFYISNDGSDYITTDKEMDRRDDNKTIQRLDTDYIVTSTEIEKIVDAKVMQRMGIDYITGSNNIDKIEDDKCIQSIGTDYIATSQEIENIVDGKVIQRMEKDKPCIIDQNLEKALEDENNKEFSLDDILVTPKVYPGASAASTPTITNILFGENVELNENSTENSKKYVDAIDNMKVLEEFLENKEPILNKTEVIDINSNDFEVPMDVDEVDTGTKEIIKKEVSLSIYDEKLFDLENLFCYICSKKFDNSKSICMHFVKKHKIQIIKPKDMSYKYKPRICNICGVEIRNLQNFHRHLKRHKIREVKEARVYKCERCSLEFSSQSKLDKHAASHGGSTFKKKPGKYVCTICGASISNIDNFKLHQRRHTNNYTHKCEECEKGFYRKSDLEVHKRLHTGEKPFPCTHCNKSFSRKDALTKHVKHHIGDLPFECEHCKSRFTNSTGLKVHMKSSKNCRKLRGIVEVVEEKTEENQIEEIQETNEVNMENSVQVDEIRSQLPYIDTEMSN